MQHNLTSSALALIPFSLAADSNPSTICSIIMIWRGKGGGEAAWLGRGCTEKFRHLQFTKQSILRLYIKNITDLR